jgi:beta-glucanase (GH16 family)
MLKLFSLSGLLFLTCLLKNDSGFKEDFNKPESSFFRYGSTGTKAKFKYKMGKKSSTEKGTRILSFKIDPNEKAGAGKGPEIISKDETHFGRYSARLKVPDIKDIQPNVGAVVGYFTYQRDKDLGLSEIDYEWLIADPKIIYIGTWTGFSPNLQRIGRIINLAEGEILETISKVGYGGERTHLTGRQNIPEKIEAIPEYDASKHFYTYGFDWKADEMRWWMIHPTSSDTLDLWHYSGSTTGIPQHPSKYRMKFWHTDNWSVETNPNSIEKPKEPYELEVDWMSYQPF